MEPGVVPACNYAVTWEGEYVDLGPGVIELRDANYEYDGRRWDRYRCTADTWSWGNFSVDDFWMELSIAEDSPIGSSEFRICAFHDG